MTRQTKRSPKAIAAELERQAVKRAQARADAKQPENWGVSADTLKSPSVAAKRAGKAIIARRVPWYVRVLDAGSPRLLAYERYLNLVAIRRGEDDNRSLAVTTGGSRALVSDKMLAAGDEIDAVAILLPPTTRRLIQSLVDVSDDMGWQMITAHITGERHANAMAGIVRHACESLAWAFEQHDYRAR